MKTSKLPWILLSLSLVTQAALYYGLFLPDYTTPHVERFIYFSIALSALWIATLYLGNKFTTVRAAKTFLYSGIVAGLLFRVICFSGSGLETHLSDDVYRYIFDGKITAHGVNPLAFAPDHPILESYADSVIYPQINHADLPSVYPPFSQFFFVISYLIDSDSILGFKIVSALFDLLALLALLYLVRLSKLPDWLVLIYWLSPLVITEFTISSHHDMLFMPPLILALIAFQRKLPGWCGAALACAVLAKFNIALIVLPLFLGFAPIQRWRFVSLFVLISGVLYAPYHLILNPPELLGSLGSYLSKWQYNGSIYTALQRALAFFTTESAHWARLTVATTLVALWLLISVRVKDKISASALCLLCYYALTTTLFPWYLLALYPFMILRRLAPAFALIALVSLSYWGLIDFLETDLWYDNWYLRWLSYIPFYALLLIPQLRRVLLEPRDPERFAL